jgi:hypothetical protein
MAEALAIVGGARMSSRPAFSSFVIMLAAFSGRAYAQVAATYCARYGAWYMLFCTICFGVFAAGLWLAAGIIATLYFADRPLLKGAHIVGEVLQLDVERYIPKWGSKVEYDTLVTYAYTDPDGRHVTHTMRRTLIAPPQLKRGGPIDLLYEPGNPEHSTMSTEFERGLAQKPFLAWLFLLLGFYPPLYVYRYMRWRRETPASES